ncbi:unnamed protein product [marine sediment metagenome]|uniref:Zinc finger CHC2-type domain-containing protein n=1 Tax=marine sediment metagenome TaxID=412755 RepID=X0Z709_9ZZZZ
MTDYHSIKQRAKEMGIPLEEALVKRKHFLQEEIRHWTNIIQAAKKDAPFGSLEQKLDETHIDEAIKELKRLEWECTKLNPEWIDNQGGVNRETIAQAKAVPINTLLPYPVTHNMTKCPFHEKGKSDSTMTTKNNFAWCFHCNLGWDTISLVMELHGKTFREAVLDLSGT